RRRLPRSRHPPLRVLGLLVERGPAATYGELLRKGTRNVRDPTLLVVHDGKRPRRGRDDWARTGAGAPGRVRERAGWNDLALLVAGRSPTRKRSRTDCQDSE